MSPMRALDSSSELPKSPANSSDCSTGSDRALTLVCQKCRKLVVIHPFAVCASEFGSPLRPSSSSRLESVSLPSLPLDPDTEVLEWPKSAKVVLDHVAETAQIGQPLCPECTKAAAAELETKLSALQEDTANLEGFLAQLPTGVTKSGGGNVIVKLQSDLDELERQERKLLEELAVVEIQEGEVHKEAAVIDREREDLEAQIQTYWRSCNEYVVEDNASWENSCAAQEQLRACDDELSRLNQANLLNEAFHIWFDGHFGTVNNFRLGRLPVEQVDWTEINAAWGYAALLLHTIAEARRFQWTKFRVVPKGSVSLVEEISKKSINELYGGAQVLFAARRFDRAMTGFLFCLEELISSEIRLHDSSPPPVPPYPIFGDTVGALTVRLSQNSEENWTRAMKYLLCDLKWLIALVCSP
eukprot:RCo005825